MCFLEREVYAFLSTFDKRGERVRGAMLRARIFCLWEGRRNDVRGGQWTGRGWVAGGTCEGLVGKAAQEERRMRDAREREEGYSWGKIGGQLFCLPSGGSRSAAVAALGYRHRREKRCAVAARGGRTQLVEGCGLWPPFQLIQLIYLCESAEREKRMDVCFLLTLYI